MPVVDSSVAAVTTAASSLRILGHPNRLAIAVLLLEGACAVSEIESRLRLRQPNLSQHLGLLRDAGLLTSERQAKSVRYALADGPVRRLVREVAHAFGLTDIEPAMVAARPAEPAGQRRPRPTDSDDEGSRFAYVLQGEG